MTPLWLPLLLPLLPPLLLMLLLLLLLLLRSIALPLVLLLPLLLTLLILLLLPLQDLEIDEGTMGYWSEADAVRWPLSALHRLLHRLLHRRYTDGSTPHHHAEPAAGAHKRRLWKPVCSQRAYFESGGSVVPVEKPPAEAVTAVTAVPKKAREPAAKVPFHGRLLGTPLIGVLLKIGGEAGTAVGDAVEPTDAMRQLMGTLSAMLPQMRWVVVQMVEGLGQPLLPDEEEAIEAAAVVLLETVRDDVTEATLVTAAAGGTAGTMMIFI